MTSIREPLEIARAPSLRWAWWLVASSGFALALPVALGLGRLCHFTYHDNGVISAISRLRYPKQMDLFYYAAALAFVPAWTGGVVVAWLWWSERVSRRAGRPLPQVLRADALGHLPLWLAVAAVGTRPSWLWPWVGASVAASVVARLAARRGTGAVAVEAATAEGAPASRSARAPLRDAALLVLAAGLCAAFGLAALVRPAAALFLATPLAALLIWLASSWLAARWSRDSFETRALRDALCYVPAVGLLVPWILYPSQGSLAAWLTLSAIVVLKLALGLRPPPWLAGERARSAVSAALDYLVMPALIYVLTYNRSLAGELDPFHEGEHLAPLSDLLRGKIPFRDIYLQHGLIENAYLPLLASWWHGASLESVRLLRGLVQPLGYVCLYILGRQVLSSRIAALVAVLVMFLHVSWFGARQASGLLALALVASSLLPSRGPLVKLALAGLAAALALFYSLEVGLYTTAACAIFLAMLAIAERSPRRLLAFLLGLGLGCAPFVAYFAGRAAVGAMLRNAYLQCTLQLPRWGLPFPALATLLGELETSPFARFLGGPTFPYYLPIGILLVVAASLVQRAMLGSFWRSRANAKLLLIAIAAALFFRTTLGLCDPIHLANGTTLTWLLAILIAERATSWIWSRRLGWPLKVLPAALPGMALAFYLGCAYYLAPRPYLFLRTPTLYDASPDAMAEPFHRAGHVKLPDAQTAQVKRIVEHVRTGTSDQEPIFAFGNLGAYYFFTDRRNATRYPQVAYACTSELQAEVIADLERERVSLVLFSDKGPKDLSTSEKYPDIARYLAEHYAEEASYGEVKVLRRKRS